MTPSQYWHLTFSLNRTREAEKIGLACVENSEKDQRRQTPHLDMVFSLFSVGDDRFSVALRFNCDT